MKKKKSTWDAQCFFQSQKLVTAILPMISNITHDELGRDFLEGVKDRLEEFKTERFPMLGFGWVGEGICSK